MEKKLYRSKNRIIAGVCGGLAEYMNMDPTVVRVIYVLLSLCTAFAGVLAYLILMLVIPDGASRM